ncbi:MFS transporter [Liquorilactobacillus hordei]|uniref:MFS transporter n=1 Tax=Liquorilactobacillus hordei TaxID=468911 RepID=UPI0039E76520
MNKTNSTWVLILTSLGFFMSMMDSMIVTTASTAIRNDFNITVNQLQWALNAYNVTIAAVLLLGVSLGDYFGHRKVYNFGILVFVIGSILCALSTNINFLIFSRIIEGIGASVITPMSMAILTSALAPEERGKALGIWSGIGGLALIIGPALGGFIVAKLVWQWIFWINVPIGLVAIYLSQKKLPESKKDTVFVSIADATLIILSSAGIIWTLSESKTLHVQIQVLFIGIISIIMGIIFILHQKNEAEPMVPLKFFKSNSFNGGNISTFLLYASMYGVVFFLPQYFQFVNHSSALVSGLKLLPWTGTLVLVAPFAGNAVDKFGERIISIIGLLLQGIGYIWIAIYFRVGTSYLLIIIPLVLAGTGLSMAGPALQKSVVGSVKRNEIGKASGIYNMFRLFGGAVGVTVAVMIFNAVGNSLSVVGFSKGFEAAMLGSGLLSLLGIIFSLLIPKKRA